MVDLNRSKNSFGEQIDPNLFYPIRFYGGAVEDVYHGYTTEVAAVTKMRRYMRCDKAIYGVRPGTWLRP